MSVNLSVLSAGAVTSAGLSLPATAAAIRAAVDNFQETHFLDQNGEPLLGGKIHLHRRSLEEDDIRGGRDHLPRLLDQAVGECLDQPGLDHANTALLLILPEEARRMDLQALEADCLARWHQRVGSTPAPVQVFRQGSVACVPALRDAQRMLEQGLARQVLIAGVDSWLNTPSIRVAMDQERIDDSGAGLIPAEGAAALLLGPPSARAHLRIRGLGQEEEPATLFVEEPCFGKGLAKAMKQALSGAGLQPHDIHLHLADLSGEEYFAFESLQAWNRLIRKSSPPGYAFVLPASSLGEVGASFGLLMVAYALHLARIRRAPGPNVLIQLSSAGTSRSALVCTCEE